MDFIFNSSPSWIVSSILVMFPSILFCLIILWIVRKTFSIHELRKNHDVVGFSFSIIGVLYSVILGFTVISAQSRYNEVLQTVENEAIMLADLYRDAGLFAPEEKQAIRTSLRNYVDYVIKKEWWQPIERKIRMETQDVMEKIWKSYYDITIRDEKTKIWYAESISKLDNFMNARLSRQFSSWQHLGTMMWTLLIVGAVVTISFMYFFGLESLHVQMMMTALIAGYLSFMLYLVFSLDNVLKGPEGIKPDSLEQIYALFDRWDQAER
ncbi:MAG: DUF4239 domain-containing protein [Chlamydiota bacterium]